MVGHIERRLAIPAAFAVAAALTMGCGSGERREVEEAAPAVARTPEAGEAHLANIRQLTFGGQNAEAYFAAGGTQLIFQRTEAEDGCDQQFVMNTDGSGMRRVSSGLGRTTCGYFYANDARVIYASTVHLSDSCPPNPDMSKGYVWPIPDFDLYTSNVDGTDVQRLTNSPGYDAEATLSPDGATIVFTSTRDGDLDIYTMNVDGTNVRRLTNTPGYDGGPFFSPDGTKIVYRASRPESAAAAADYTALLAEGLVRPSALEIWVMNADGTEQRQITNLGGANFAPYFHRDGQRVIFSSNHHNPGGRNFDLFMVSLDGGAPVQITTHADFDGFPMFSPDGRQIVFASNRFGAVPGETNIFIADWVESP